MFSASTPECSHCHSLKSPLWRRGEKGEVLCNACGLYWRNHGSKRPLNLKRPATPPRDPNRPDHTSIKMKFIQTDWTDHMKRSRIDMIEKPPTPNDLAIQTEMHRYHGFHISPSMPKFQPSSALDVSFCRFPLPKDLARMKDICDSISVVDLSPITKESSQLSSDTCTSPSYDLTDSIVPSPNMELVSSLVSSPTWMTLSSSFEIHSNLRSKKAPIYYFGKPYYIDDIILVKGRAGDHYFGRINQLFVNEYGQKFFSMTWMIPKKESLPKLDDIKSLQFCDFEEASVHQGIESMDCILGIVLPKSSIMSSQYTESISNSALTGDLDTVTPTQLLCI